MQLYNPTADEVSVLICAHSKDEAYDALLRRALDSVLKQTQLPDQIVLVLDECWPGTSKMCSEILGSSGVSYHIEERPKKEGLAAAKNCGLLRCSGGLIMMLDADDDWMPTKIELQRNFMIQNPTVSACGTLAWDRHPNGDIKPSCFAVGQFETHDEIVWALHYQNVLCHTSMCFREKALSKVRGYNPDPRFLGKEDWELYIRLIQAGHRLHQLQERLVFHSLGTSVER